MYNESEADVTARYLDEDAEVHLTMSSDWALHHSTPGRYLWIYSPPSVSVGDITEAPS